MAIFLRVVAVLVGLVNVYVAYEVDPARAIVEMESSTPVLTLVLRAVVAGLVASEIVLRLMRPALWGSYFARYAVTVLALCLGGLIFGASIPLIGFLLEDSPGIQPGIEGFLVGVALGAVFGGALGALEGLVLAFPLAVILRRLRNEN